MAKMNARALRRLDGRLQQLIDQGRLPGAVVALGAGGELVHRAALGRRDPAVDQAMPADAIFRIYSMTKPIVSLAALMLAERGQLQLSDPVSAWLPAFAATRVGAEGAPLQRPPTVHDLLRHTAGFTYEFLGDGPVQQAYREARLWDRNRSAAEFCEALAALPLVAQPGSCWHYSRATDVLGALLEVVSGQPLGALLQELILGPLGMADTAFSVPAAQQHRIAEPFARCPDSGAAVEMMEARSAPRFESGGGGLLSTADDYLRFIALLRNHGRVDGQRLVGRTTVQWMLADHLGSIPVLGELLPPGQGCGGGGAGRTATGLAPQPGSPGQYFWSGIGGTFFFVDPVEDVFALLLAQTPNQRIEFRNLFRHLVYACIE